MWHNNEGPYEPGDDGTPLPKPDFRIRNEGSIVRFYTNTDAAERWWEEHVDPECPTFGDWYCVDHRFAQDIIWGIEGDGLTIEP